jgi:hypothetical protein
MKKHTQSNKYETAVILTASKMGYDARNDTADAYYNGTICIFKR